MASLKTIDNPSTQNPKPPSKNKWFALVGLGLTTALLMWTWRDIEPVKLWQTVKAIQWLWLVPGLVTFITAFVVRSHRWGILLATHQPTTRFSLRQAAIFIGFAGNCVLPANAGELIRAGLLKRFADLPFGITLGSLITERLLDAIAAFIFLMGPLVLQTQATQDGLNWLALGFLGLVLLIVYSCLLLAAWHPHRISRYMGRLSTILRLGKYRIRLESGFQQLLGGFAVLKSPSSTALAIVDSFGIWALSGFTFWCGLKAFNITGPGFIGALFIQSLEALAIALPSAPGHLGAFEASIRFALSLYAVTPETAVGYTLVMRLLIYGSLTLIGGLYALAWGVKLQELTSKK
jgi:glycosyltransferase 2 family protein